MPDHVCMFNLVSTCLPLPLGHFNIRVLAGGTDVLGYLLLTPS